MLNQIVPKIKKITFIFLIIILGIIAILKGNAATIGVKNGLLLCSSIIIPSLFLFTVIALLFIKSNAINFAGEKLNSLIIKVFGLNISEFSIFILSLIGGYPIGAKLINEQFAEEKITKQRANLLLYCSINAGPSFIIFTVGYLMLNSKSLGLILFVSNLLTSLIFALICFKFIKSKSSTIKSTTTTSLTDSFVISVEQTSRLFINICGWVIFFSGICEIINSLSMPDFVKNLCSIFSEVTISVATAKKLKFAPYFFSFLLSFGGLSTICQIKSAAKNLNPNIFLLFINRLFHGGISALLTFILLKIFPRATETLSNGVVAVWNGFEWNFVSLFLMVVAVFFIIYVKQ